MLPRSILTPDQTNLGWRSYALLALLCLAFYLPGFFTLPVLDRDEPHFAQATRQMIESNNFTDIRFQNETRYKKPVGIYWLQAISVKIFSPDNLQAIWAYRIPSLLGASMSILLTAALGCLLFGPSAGFCAALLLLSCLVLNTEARIAKTDAALLACIMAAQYSLARAYKSREGLLKAGWGNALTFWIAQGIGFLIKGPFALLISLATIIAVWPVEKRLGWLKTLKPQFGLPLAMLIIAPWFVAISMASHGAFLQESAGHDLLAKIWQGQDRGMIPPGVHFIALIAVFFPASLVVLLALPDIWRRKREMDMRFLLGWIIPTWLVFELTLTKLPHYVMPTYPALAILAAKLMLDGFPALTERKFRWLPPLVIGLWFLIGAAIVAGLTLLPNLLDGTWLWLPLAAGIAILTLQAASVVALPRQPVIATLLIGLTGFILVCTALGSVLPNLNGLWLSPRIVTALNTYKPCADSKLYKASYDEPSLVFLSQSKMLDDNDSLMVANHLREDSCNLGLVDASHKAEFLASFTGQPKQPENLIQIKGYNIGSGHNVDLTLYKLSQP